MIINLVEKNYHVASYTMDTTFTRLRNNLGVVGDSLTKSQSSYEVYDFAENNAKYKSADFDISSLLEVGAYDMLKPTFVSTMSDMDFADKFQNINIAKPE